jgi:hypothetical protein
MGFVECRTAVVLCSREDYKRRGTSSGGGEGGTVAGTPFLTTRNTDSAAPPFCIGCALQFAQGQAALRVLDARAKGEGKG